MSDQKIILPKPDYKFDWNYEVLKKVASDTFPDLQTLDAIRCLLEAFEQAYHGLILTPINQGENLERSVATDDAKR